MIRRILGSLRSFRMPRKVSAVAFYAVNTGRRKGVVSTWAECESLVKGFPGAKFKKFNSLEEADAFARGVQSSSETLSLKMVTAKAADKAKKRARAEISNDEPTSNEIGSSSLVKRIHKAQDNELDIPVVYTDGACSGNGKIGAKAGIGVYWGDGDPRNVSEPLEGKQTNNRAEIQAAIKAILQAKEQGFSQIEVRTDSKFLVKSITEWIPGWQRKSWKTASGNPVINKEDFVDLIDAANGIDIKWTHVAGHAGIHGNEQADSLAVSGMLKRKQQGIS